MAATAEDAILDVAAIFHRHTVHQDTVEQLHMASDGAVHSDHTSLHGAFFSDFTALAEHGPYCYRSFWSHGDSLVAEIALCVGLGAQELAGELWASQLPAAGSTFNTDGQ